MRQMALVAFLQAQNCSNFVASWRHPDSRTDYTSPAYYQHIARVLEEGKFHLGFFDDRLAMPEFSGGDFSKAVEAGVRCIKMDPTAIMMSMAAVTTSLGIGATMSTTYYEPFHIARLFATIDLMTNGRAAWNVVTSLNDVEARNMGREKLPAHDTRYDRADEFMQVVLGHWDSWEDDALIVDKANNLFADPGKVHKLDHKGDFFSSGGPFTVPRSQQGYPVIMQAGQSGRGQRFAAQWGELLFIAYNALEKATATYRAIKEDAAAAGRDPDSIKLAYLCYPIVAETKMEAEDKRAALEKLPTIDDSLMLLSEVLNVDFGAKGLDEPFSNDELNAMTGLQTIRDRVIDLSGKPNPTVRDFIQVSKRGQLPPAWVGGPKEVADIMEEWFTQPACDGFVTAATTIPGTYEDVVKFLVPELQKRGLYHKDYSGATLRENLGLPKPPIGDWRKRSTLS